MNCPAILINHLKKHGRNFIVEKRGNTTQVLFNKCKLKMITRSLEKPKTGFQITALFKKDFLKRFKLGDYCLSDKIQNPQPYYYDFCNKNIRFTHDEIYAIDIKNCYWETAYRLGMMSDKIYEYGLSLRYESEYEQEEIKTMRNACIGGLFTPTLIEHYRDGKMIDSKNIDSKYAKAYFQVINTVYELSQKAIRGLNGNFLYFLTDCFFVKNGSVNSIVKCIQRAGYEYNVKSISLQKVEFNKAYKKIIWREGNGNEDKYYSFSKIQQVT